MKRSIYKKSTLDILRSAIIPILFTVVIMGMVVFGLYQAEVSSRAEGLRVLEESIHRAMVKNYAIEGRYPASIEDLEERYGVYIDRTKYVVHYIAIGPNLFPEVMVIELDE